MVRLRRWPSRGERFRSADGRSPRRRWCRGHGAVQGFDLPVAANEFGELGRGGLLGDEAGDGVDRPVDLRAAVADAPGVPLKRDVLPGKGLELSAQLLLAALDDHDVVGALAEIPVADSPFSCQSPLRLYGSAVPAPATDTQFGVGGEVPAIFAGGDVVLAVLGDADEAEPGRVDRWHLQL